MSKIRASAKGETCQVRLPGCFWGGETVVWAHLPIPGTSGVGMKAPDTHGTYACAACHDKIDGRGKVPDITFDIPENELRRRLNLALIKAAAMEGHMRSLVLLQEKGLIG